MVVAANSTTSAWTTTRGGEADDQFLTASTGYEEQGPPKYAK